MWEMTKAWIIGVVAALAFAGAPARAEAPPPVEDYGKLPGVEQVEVSPSGGRYALVVKDGDKRSLAILTSDNQVIEAKNLGMTKVEGLEWAGDDHLLIFVSSTVQLGMFFSESKAELGGAVVVDIPHHKAFSVFSPPSQKRVAHTVVGAYGTARIDGRWYGYFGGYTYNADTSGGARLNQDDEGRLYPDLYRVDLDTGDFTLASRGQPGVDGWLVSPSGKIDARLIYNERHGDWRLQGGDTGGPTITSGHAAFGGPRLLGYGRSGSTVLLRVAGEPHDIIQELPLGGGKAVSETDAGDGAPLYDPVTRLWIGSNAADGGAPSLFDAGANAKARGALQAFAGYVGHIVSFSADLNHMIAFTEGGDDSGTFWQVDIAGHAARVIGSSYPTVTSAYVGTVKWVDYKAADGLAMRGVLTLPPGRPAHDLPLVVMPHGGPEAHDSPSFDWWAQAFASRGYAVFQPNFRGSTGKDNAFIEAGYGQWGRKMQTDISDGVTELARRKIVDPSRACIVGASYGGYAALAGVTIQHGLYRCAASYGGVSDPAGMLRQESEAHGAGAATRFWREFMGVKSTWNTGLDDISPVHLAAQADAPILLIHGQDDTVVLIEQSQAMQRALERNNKPVELITLPGADHWLLHEDARIAMLKAAVGFVIKHNPPDPPPTSVATR
jgi:dienelactone hydrolase